MILMRTCSNEFTEYQLAISYSQARLPVQEMVAFNWVAFNWVAGQVCSMKIIKQPKMILRQKFAIGKLTVGSHSQGQHPHNTMNLKKLIWSLHGALLPCSSLFGSGRYSAGYQKRNVDTITATKPLIYNLPSLQNMLETWWHITYGGNQPLTHLT